MLYHLKEDRTKLHNINLKNLRYPNQSKNSLKNLEY